MRDGKMILRVEDIHTYYGDAYVLQGLSLELGEGQILGLLGRNGVGKTTLVNSIVGFNRRAGEFSSRTTTSPASPRSDREARHGPRAQGRRVFIAAVEERISTSQDRRKAGR
jgi:branched-chain amino acid transport system ATP-binding protein